MSMMLQLHDEDSFILRIADTINLFSMCGLFGCSPSAQTEPTVTSIKDDLIL